MKGLGKNRQSLGGKPSSELEKKTVSHNKKSEHSENRDTSISSMTDSRKKNIINLSTVSERKSGSKAGAEKSVRKKSEKNTKPKRRAPALVSSNAGLVASNLGKSYGGRPVLRDVTIQVNRGEVVGLLGPNGAGKTTSFYIVCGLVSPDYGTVSLDGNDVTKLPMYRRARMGVGYLPQESSIFRGMTVEQNILSILEIAEPIAEKRYTRLDELLAEFSITHLRQSPAVALSGGERRRVEIARALASSPSFILLDEPFAGIDPIAVGDIRQLVGQLKNRGIGVLITDHNVRETLDIIDRAYIIHEGKVLRSGSPAEVVGDKDVRRFYLGESFSL